MRAGNLVTDEQGENCGETCLIKKLQGDAISFKPDTFHEPTNYKPNFKIKSEQIVPFARQEEVWKFSELR